MTDEVDGRTDAAKIAVVYEVAEPGRSIDVSMRSGRLRRSAGESAAAHADGVPCTLHGYVYRTAFLLRAG